MEKLQRAVRLAIIIGLCLLVLEVAKMPHGQRAWSNIGADQVVHGLADSAELAARLGSADTHNREGNVVFIEGFEHGMQPWNPAASGTGGEVRVSNLAYRSSGYSCRLHDGSEYAYGAQISRPFPIPVLGRYGFEFSFHPDDNLQYLIATLAYRDGTIEHQFQVTYDAVEETLLQTIPGGSSVAFAAGVDLYTGEGIFHTLKLVADLAGDAWVRVILDENEFELTDYGPYTFAWSGSPHINLIITTYGQSGLSSTIYVDDIIVTQNEPE